MVKIILTRALQALAKKPMRLWGISLLNLLLCSAATTAFVALPVVGVCIGLLLNTAMTMIYLRGYRGEETQVTQLFDCFKDWATIKRVLCGMLWMLLWIFLWGMIPVVGIVFAIIRSYEYRLTPYILVMEPDVSVTEAIKVSKERTNGYKGKMFGADVLVGAIIFGVFLALAILCAIPYLGVVFALALLLVWIVVVIFLPLYMGMVQSAFYEEITNPTMPVVKTAAYPPVGSCKFCANCGTPMELDCRFCPKCGTPSM